MRYMSPRRSRPKSVARGRGINIHPILSRRLKRGYQTRLMGISHPRKQTPRKLAVTGRFGSGIQLVGSLLSAAVTTKLVSDTLFTGLSHRLTVLALAAVKYFFFPAVQRGLTSLILFSYICPVITTTTAFSRIPECSDDIIFCVLVAFGTMCFLCILSSWASSD